MSYCRFCDGSGLVVVDAIWSDGGRRGVTVGGSSCTYCHGSGKDVRMPNIALIGGFGAGKTDIAKTLAGLTDGFVCSFAAELKREVAAALQGVDSLRGNTSVNHLSRMRDVSTKDDYRLILQWWGTEFRRAQDNDYWVKLMSQTLSTIYPGSSIAVDDCRFDNERDLLLKFGFKFVRLEPGPHMRDQGERNNHVSEEDWKKWPVDLSLSYEEGLEHQAQKILASV